MGKPKEPKTKDKPQSKYELKKRNQRRGIYKDTSPKKEIEEE